MTKDKELLSLKKIVEIQKKKNNITQRFSFRWDNKTEKLILSYSIPHLVNIKGTPKTRLKRKQKYYPSINKQNYKKWFRDRTSFLVDCDNFVKNEVSNAEGKLTNYQDEFDLGYWIEKFLDRKVGKTTEIKPLSPHTIKQNKRILNPYYIWLLDKHKNSNEMREHIDNGADWFEQYYQEKLLSGDWNNTTCMTAFRNVRGFYNFIADYSKGSFPYDLLKRLQLKSPKHTRDTINSWEYDKIIDFIIENQDNEFWKKFVLMLRLQLKSGLRVGELTDIRNRNIDEKDKTIWVSGKTGRRPLHFRHEDDQKIWNDILEKKGSGIYLFYRTKVVFYPKQKHKIEVDLDLNKPTTSSFYLQRFRQMRTLLGLRGKGVITSHSIRRYFITQFVKETKNRDLVRQIVGHSSTKMTDYYMGDMIDEDTKTTISIGV